MTQNNYGELILIYDKLKELGESEIKEIKIDLIPESLSYSYSPSFQSQQILGRYTPIYTYQSGSDEVYSFGLKLHEDLIDKTKYNTIQDLVDTIKSLSYPREKNGVLIFPRVYMQLGEIAGFGLVQTSVNWELPLREGRYTVVSIDFTFTIEDSYPNPIIGKQETLVKGLDNAIYKDKLLSYKYEEYYNYIYKPEDYVTNANNYNENIFEYKSAGDAYRESNYVKLEFEYAKLEKLYGVFRKINIEGASVMSNLKAMISYSNRINTDTFKTSTGRMTKDDKVPGLNITAKTTNYLTELDQSAHMEEVDNFLDSYIEENLYSRFLGDTEEAEKFKKEIKASVLDIYANIYELWRGAMTYGSSN